MKKILSIAFAGILGILAISCGKDEKAVFRASDSIAPVLGNVSVGKKIVVAYTPAVFKMNFNDSMATYHTLGLVKIDSTKVNLTLKAAKDDATKHELTITSDNLTSLLLGRGYEYGQTAKLSIVVRASIQDPAKGVTNGYVDSEESYEFELKLKKPSGGAYAAFTEASEWSVIGTIASTGNNWNADEEMSTDGTWHVCEGIELTTSDEFKFRKGGAWTENFGGTFTALDEEFDVTQDGPNIKVDADGVYDLLLNPATGKAKIVVHKEDPFAAYTQDSNWSVIGSIASTGNSWNADEEMTSNGEWHVCRDLELTTSDEFKFRMDGAWGTNFGGACGALGEEFDVTQDGPNIQVPEDGTFNLFLNPTTAKAKIEKAN